MNNKRKIKEKVVTLSFSSGACIPLYLSYHIISFISDLVSSNFTMNIPMEQVKSTCQIEFRARYTDEPTILVDLDGVILVNGQLDSIQYIYNVYEMFCLNCEYFNMQNPTIVIRTHDTLGKAVLKTIAIIGSVIKAILYFLKDENMNEETILRIIKRVEPLVLGPISLSACIFETRKQNSMDVPSDSNFLGDLVVLGIDLTEEAVDRESALIDQFFQKQWLRRDKVPGFVHERCRQVADQDLALIRDAIFDNKFQDFGEIIQTDSRNFASFLLDCKSSIVVFNDFQDVMVTITDGINHAYMNCQRTNEKICFQKYSGIQDIEVVTLKKQRYQVQQFLNKLFEKFHFQPIENHERDYIEFNCFSYKILKEIKKIMRIKDIKVVEFEQNIQENVGEFTKRSGLTPRHKEFDTTHPEIEERVNNQHADNQLENGVRVQVENFQFVHSDESNYDKKINNSRKLSKYYKMRKDKNINPMDKVQNNLRSRMVNKQRDPNVKEKSLAQIEQEKNEKEQEEWEAISSNYKSSQANINMSDQLNDKEDMTRQYDKHTKSYKFSEVQDIEKSHCIDHGLKLKRTDSLRMHQGILWTKVELQNAEKEYSSHKPAKKFDEDNLQLNVKQFSLAKKSRIEMQNNIYENLLFYKENNLLRDIMNENNMEFQDLDEIKEFEILLFLENIPLQEMTSQIMRLITDLQNKFSKLVVDNYKIWRLSLERSSSPDKAISWYIIKSIKDQIDIKDQVDLRLPQKVNKELDSHSKSENGSLNHESTSIMKTNSISAGENAHTDSQPRRKRLANKTVSSTNNQYQSLRRFIMDQIVEFAMREELRIISELMNDLAYNAIMDSQWFNEKIIYEVADYSFEIGADLQPDPNLPGQQQTKEEFTETILFEIQENAIFIKEEKDRVVWEAEQKVIAEELRIFRLWEDEQALEEIELMKDEDDHERFMPIFDGTLQPKEQVTDETMNQDGFVTFSPNKINVDNENNHENYENINLIESLRPLKENLNSENSTIKNLEPNSYKSSNCLDRDDNDDNSVEKTMQDLEKEIENKEYNQEKTIQKMQKELENRQKWNLLNGKLNFEKNSSGREIRKQLFEQIDLDQSKKLSINEIKTQIELILGKIVSTIDIDKVVRLSVRQTKKLNLKDPVTNINSDSKDIEFHEFRNLIYQIRQYIEYYYMFEVLDHNEGGSITFSEFEKSLDVLESWGVKIGDPQEAFKEMDKDGSQIVKFEEFVEYALHQKLDMEVEQDDDDISDNDVKSNNDQVNDQ